MPDCGREFARGTVRLRRPHRHRETPRRLAQGMTDASPWWRGAAIYQIYPRSYADGNADGVGDIAGIRARLAHLRDLGVDALWISPWYVSPMADAGYDVADYR